MKTALRIHIALNEFVVGAICLTVLVASVAYFKVHHSAAPAAPAPIKVECTVKEPTVEISKIVYYIPVPVKVTVKVEPPPAPAQNPDVFIPDPNLDHAPPPQPEADPVFQHRTPIITSALRTPMSELDKK
jgi:hypothetical protein